MRKLGYLIPFTSYDMARNGTKCPLCQSDAYATLSSWDRRLKSLPHVKCSNCGFVRQHPLPSPAGVDAYYASEYRADYQGSSDAPTQRHVMKRRAEAERRYSVLKDFLKPGSAVLDCGCGSGEFVEIFQERGFVAAGFEPGQGYANYARNTRKLDVTCASYETFKADRKFDAVTSFHVFEHLIDPVKAFETLASFLAPGGVIHLETPNIRNALSQKGFGCLHLAHTVGYTRSTLEYVGALNGFEIAGVDDRFDIGLVFRRGQPRPLEIIAADGRAELATWTNSTVHKQFWRYTFGKILPWRRTTSMSQGG